MTTRIDVHAHYSPPAYISRMAELGAFEELPIFTLLKSLSLPGWKDAPDPTPAEVIATRIVDMDAASIDVQIIGLGAVQPYFGDEAKATEGARLANDLLAQLISPARTRFGVFGALPLPHVDRTLEEIERGFDEMGFLGFGLGCSAAGIPLDDARFDPVWAQLDARRAVVFIHPGVGIDGIVGCADHHLAPDFVSPAEIAVCASRLVVEGVTTRFPNVSIILATTGGSLPFFARRFDRGFRQANPELHEKLGGFIPGLRGFYYDTSVLEEPEVLRAAVDLVGADRLVLGSDYSRPGVTSAHAVQYVTDAECLGDHDKLGILGETAGRILSASR